MKAKKIGIAITAWICFTVLLFQSVHALGVSPGIHRIEFSPLEKYQNRFTLVNDDASPIVVSLFKQGELAPYLSLPSQVSITSLGSIDVAYTLDLPPALSPGFHDVEILVTEESSLPSGETVIGATVAVITKIKVFVPYPEAYAVVDLVIAEHPSGIEFKIPVENLGQKEINHAYATIRLTDKTTPLTTLTTETITIPAQQRRDLITEWVLPERGTYTAEVTLHYDGKEMTLKKEFSYQRTETLAIADIQTKNLALGKVAEVTIVLDNKGNDILEDISATIAIANEQDEIISTLTSPKISINPAARENLKLAWDASALQEGTYTLMIKVQAQGKIIERKITTTLSPQGATIPSPTGKAITTVFNQEKTKLSLWIVGIGVVSIILLMLFWWWKRNKSKQVL